VVAEAQRMRHLAEHLPLTLEHLRFAHLIDGLFGGVDPLRRASLPPSSTMLVLAQLPPMIGTKIRGAGHWSWTRVNSLLLCERIRNSISPCSTESNRAPPDVALCA
jgi:hypothetical protein